jgi:hypothetical protein
MLKWTNRYERLTKMTPIDQRLSEKGYTICRKVFKKTDLLILRKFLTDLMNGSLPKYQALEHNCENFFRVNFDDTRSIVKTCSVQFNFFPWNQDLLNVFNSYSTLFDIRMNADKIFSNERDDDSYFSDKKFIRRISIQYYPQGGGYMQAHSDPIGNHQISVATVVMSKSGEDYFQGGMFVKINGEKIYPENDADIGDVILIKGDLEHGVDPIDENANFEPLSGRGRWMMLSAITKPTNSSLIPDAIPLKI